MDVGTKAHSDVMIGTRKAAFARHGSISSHPLRTFLFKAFEMPAPTADEIETMILDHVRNRVVKMEIRDIDTIRAFLGGASWDKYTAGLAPLDEE